MRNYYEVYVAGSSYHGSQALTYYADRPVLPGQIVEVPLRDHLTFGLVKKGIAKPVMKIKPLEPLALPVLPKTSLELIDWLQQYYPAPLGSIVQLFAPPNLTKKSIEKLKTNKLDLANTSKLPPLTGEQKVAVENLKKGTNVLHGETGSGKTRIYQEAAIKSIKAGKSVIILSPEIGLSSQLFNSFKEIFGNRAVLFHSNLTPAERRETWLKALTSTEPLVVVGARSALFLPIKQIGLIVIDEAHDSAYKQDQAPYYHAARVAGKLAQLNEAALIMGTATPDVTDYHIASQRQATSLRLTGLAISKSYETNIKVIDIKDRANFTRSSHLSNELLSSINRALEQKEQTLLFLNRRGTARAVVCEQCGWQALCPNCDTALIYHGDNHSIACHVCNYRSAMVSNCPKCGSVEILFKSAGTKAIVEEVQKLFPSAKVRRFDADNLKSERFEQNYNQIKNGEVDILVGTQTLAKGLDLPNLSVVGVVTADSSLFIPDYLAQERTYQLISQVLGRVGRGHRNGAAIIQTYSPESQIIKDVLKKDWFNFYRKELEERRKFLFPPFCYLLKLSCRRAGPDKAQKAAEQFASEIKNKNPKIIINGPAPAYHEKHGTKFEWQIILKSKNRQTLADIVKSLPSGWSYDIDPVNLL